MVKTYVHILYKRHTFYIHWFIAKYFMLRYKIGVIHMEQ